MSFTYPSRRQNKPSRISHLGCIHHQRQEDHVLIPHRVSQLLIQLEPPTLVDALEKPVGKFLSSSPHSNTHTTIPFIPFLSSLLTIVLAQYLAAKFQGKFFQTLPKFRRNSCQFLLYLHLHNFHSIPKPSSFLSNHPV